MNAAVLLTTPLAVVTVRVTGCPSAACGGVTAVKLRPSAAITGVIAVPPSVTVAPVRLVPVTRIGVPPLAGPLPGLTPVMVDAAATEYPDARAATSGLPGLPELTY